MKERDFSFVFICIFPFSELYMLHFPLFPKLSLDNAEICRIWGISKDKQVSGINPLCKSRFDMSHYSSILVRETSPKQAFPLLSIFSHPFIWSSM